MRTKEHFLKKDWEVFKQRRFIEQVKLESLILRAFCVVARIQWGFFTCPYAIMYVPQNGTDCCPLFCFVLSL